MEHRGTCSICGRTFRAETSDELMQRLKDHAARQHEDEVNPEELIEDID